MKASKLEQAIALIDQANSADPRTEIHEGKEWPKEQIYGIRMMEWVQRLDPLANDALLIAARAQHIRRWETPRSNYPEGKAGYYQWRTFLYSWHGEQAGTLMSQLGYEPQAIEAMQAAMQKKNIRTNPNTQCLEDAAALVFLENHSAEFAERDDMHEEKLIKIIRMTWGKMSEAGKEAALRLVLPDGVAALVGKALGE